MDNVRRVYQTTVQTVAGIARPVLDAVKHNVTQVAQNNVPVLAKTSYGEPLVKLSNSAVIDDRKNSLAKILEDYAQNRKDATAKDQNKINSSMVKLFHKTTMSHAPSTTAKGVYYNCVNSSATESGATPELVYDRLLRSSSTDPRNHAGGISGLAFAFAAILALSLHREGTPPSDFGYNKTTPYFDLSPLYGVNEMETSSIRMKDGRGTLWPDSFTEDAQRLDTLPDSVPALLVLWNRYHNYVAKQLLSYNEEGQWKDPAHLTTQECSKQDNEIFHVARSITCIHFMNAVREDFLKGLVGMPIAGPSAQVDILFDVRDMANDKASCSSSVESYLLYSFSSFAPPSLASTIHERFKQRNDASVDLDIRRRNRVGNLRRNKQDCFEDDELAELLFNAIEAKAGCPGGNAVPEWAREREILKLRQARQAKVCTLNEFRQCLGLKSLQSFEEWNPELADRAREVYDNIDELELYPGLLCEGSNSGHGFGFGYTMAWGLMTDIVTRIRCDPMFTSNFKQQVLTKWGYNDCMSGVDVESQFYTAGGSLGGTLPKLLQRTLPHNCPYDNVYCLFPFVVPEESNKYVKNHPDQKKYKVDRPKQAKIKILRTLKGISEVLNDPKIYTSPYKQNLMQLTGGYGHMLGFDDLPLHDHDLMLTLFSLMPDKGAVMRIGASFAEKAQENLQRRAVVNEEAASIDVIKDVIDATCIRWVCETLYNFTFEDSVMWRMSDSKKASAEIEARKKEKKERDDFAAYYAYIFRNTEPEFGWNTRERALAASQHLRKHLKEQLPKDKDKLKPHHVFYTQKLYRYLVRISREYNNGILLPQHSALTFLDRMMKASHLRPLKRVADGPDHHLSEIKKRYKEEAMTENKDSQSLAKGSLFQSLRSYAQITDHEADGIAAERLEEERVIANVIGLAVVISVHFSTACARAVDFYLDEKYSREKEKLVELCKNKNSSNEEIMKYIREAQRISQRFGLWRIVNLPSNEIRKIQQGFGYPDVIIKPGDRVYADFTFAHNDPQQFPEPEKVQPGRPVNSLLGLGVHKCPAGSFIDQTMPQILRVIFKQPDLKRASGRKGQLKPVTLHPDAAPWDSEIYLDGEGGFTYYPKQMVVEFNSRDLVKKQDGQVKKVDSDDKYLMIDRGCSLLVVIIVLTLILRLFTSFSLFSLFTPTPALQTGSISQINTECGNPRTTIEDWHIKAFRPKWFGLFGEPTPIIYRTPRGRKAHQISVVDLDKRDIELQTWVDTEYKGYNPVELNSTVDCGADVVKCLNLDFGSTLFVVPPGRHTVRAEIRKGDPSQPFVWGKERQRRTMWLVEACANPTTK